LAGSGGRREATYRESWSEWFLEDGAAKIKGGEIIQQSAAWDATIYA